jgi:hypothetical protein
MVSLGVDAARLRVSEPAVGDAAPWPIEARLVTDKRAGLRVLGESNFRSGVG